MSLESRHIEALRKKARRGFQGYPIATICYYGPDDTTASKVSVGIILGPDEEPSTMQKWFNHERDVRYDHAIHEQILGFVRLYEAKSVAIAPKILGCPHESPADYPVGESCPQCPFWADRDRWEGVVERDP